MDGEKNKQILYRTTNGMVMNYQPLELIASVDDKFDILFEVEKIMERVRNNVDRSGIEKGFSGLLDLLNCAN